MRGWKRLLARDAMVQLHSGKAMRGVVTERAGEFLLLKGVTLFDVEYPDGISLDGEVMLHRTEIEYFQLLQGLDHTRLGG